jgi:purine-cytosine permease-like protein
MTNNAFDPGQSIADMDDEQLPIPPHKLHGWGHFAGLYAAEHVAATEFVIGATFVALGAGIWDILIGLLIGNTLAVLSFALITSPIAVDTRLSLYTYLNRIAGDSMSRLYNVANVLIFGVISAAMITVSATAVRALFDIPPQVHPYPTSVLFVIVAIAVAVIVVLVAVFGFNAVTEFASICAPWLMVMFTVGGMVLLPALSEYITGYTTLSSFSDFVQIAGATVWTGLNAEGEPGIGMLEVAGFAWAANTFSHFGLIDMALLRYAKKKSYGLATSTGMMFGHYVAWISAGLMGAATAAMTKSSIMVVDPGEVAFYALGASGFVIVVVAGWTTANANLYRAGLAAQAVFPEMPRTKVTLLVGLAVVVASAFPFIYQSMLPLLTYAGLILVPVGGIVFAEHHIFPKIGFTRYWARYKGLQHSVPAIGTWAISLVFGFGLDALNVIPFYYLFLPTWFVSIAAYIVLAKRYGASESYPEGEQAERVFRERVHEFHAQQAARESHEPVKDASILSKVIKAIYIIGGLAVPVVLAWRVLFNSPDIYVYYVNLELFYDVTIWCTLIYFVFAYWDLKRSKALQRSGMPGARPSTQLKDA